MKNVEYKSNEIPSFFSVNRNTWDDFYPSEKWVIEKLAGDGKVFGEVLDIGCACGGLGTALCERFSLFSYSGIDISRKAIEWAKQNLKLPVAANFIAGDVLETDFGEQEYDTVFSLSCADWNIETDKIIDTAWQKVKPGGHLIISVRLTNENGINDVNRSYQYINYSGQDQKPEIANYVVFNWQVFINKIKNLSPASELIGAYGYWGKPSATSVTPYKKLAFTVFYIKKSSESKLKDARVELSLPLDLLI